MEQALLLRLFLAFAGAACFLAAAHAQSPSPQSGGPIIQGSPDVSVGGNQYTDALQKELDLLRTSSARNFPDIEDQALALRGDRQGLGGSVRIPGDRLVRNEV